MAIQTDVQKNNTRAGYTGAATHGFLATAAPPGGASQAATNELTASGSPAYARKALTWSAGAAGVATASAVYDVYSGVTVTHAGVASSITVAAATVLDFTTVTSQAFSSQGTYTVNYTFTES